MPIPLPNLDDRRFAELVEEGIRLIPGLAPTWTDHNPSDPGITFIELFAYLSEMLMYRANRVTDANKMAFVRLLQGDPAYKFELSVDEEIRLAVIDLRHEQRAVTPADFERHALAVPGVARAYCLPRRDLDSVAVDAPSKEAEAHVSVIVVPATASADPSAAVRACLSPKCLLTTRLHVALPSYLRVGIKVSVFVFADQDESNTKTQIEERLGLYFDSIRGGLDGKGLPFGQPVYVSDLYALLDGMPGVDYVTPYFEGVEQDVLVVDDTDRYFNHNGKVIGVSLLSNELVELSLAKSHIEIIRQTELIPEE